MELAGAVVAPPPVVNPSGVVVVVVGGAVGRALARYALPGVVVVALVVALVWWR